MTNSVSLLFGVHAHQPVGNFPEVMEDAHQRCYKPFLETVYRYPAFRFAAHFSGWLLEWLQVNHPQDMALLTEMTARGQVEWFGAGDMEPVLAVIPYRDRISQITAMSDRIERAYHQRPQGAWLTERVWEATVVPALADAGIRYVMVDDYHFLCAGMPRERLNGYFTTEEDGRRVDLFPISEHLRYRLPFAPAHEAVAYLESLATDTADHAAAAIYFDDIEKFGIWPETYDWVYTRGWLTQFIEGVLASPVIQCTHFKAYHETAKTQGIAYLPTVSYSEMGEWSLPAAAANEYADLVEAARQRGTLERDRAFLRGGSWKNFMTRYPEANWAHKRMLGLSTRLAAVPASQRTLKLQGLLHEAQANDAYWHGLFGGLYLPHLRRAVWSAMVELEGHLDVLQGRPEVRAGDIDLDGHDEIFLVNAQMQAVVRSDADAAVVEWSSYALRQNFGDTLRRQDEHYHRKIHAGEAAVEHGGDGIASAHDIVRFKHPVTVEDLRPDTRPRALFVESWGDEHGMAPVVYGTRVEQGGALLFLGQAGAARVGKIYSLHQNRLMVGLQTHSVGRLETRIHLAIPCCDGVAGRYVVNGEIPGGFGQSFTWDALADLRLEDHYLNGAIAVRCVPPARIEARPYHTVSQSEAGFEKIMQAVELVLSWDISGPTQLRVELSAAAL